MLRIKWKSLFGGKYDNDPENQSLYDTGTLSHRLIATVKVRSISIKLSQVGLALQDVTQANIFQSKGHHS